MEKNFKKNVINILFDQLIMNCIFNKLKNQLFLYLMINDVIKMKLKVNHGIENYVSEYGKVSTIKTIKKLILFNRLKL